jgi:hypothetical protein
MFSFRILNRHFGHLCTDFDVPGFDYKFFSGCEYVQMLYLYCAQYTWSFSLYLYVGNYLVPRILEKMLNQVLYLVFKTIDARIIVP